MIAALAVFILENPIGVSLSFVLLVAVSAISLRMEVTFLTAHQLSIVTGVVTAIGTFLILLISRLAVETGGWLDREFIVVLLCLAVVGASSVATIIFAPSRMTVIAGITVSLIIAVLIVEAGLWFDGYMRSRLSDETVSLIVNSNEIYGYS